MELLRLHAISSSVRAVSDVDSDAVDLNFFAARSDFERVFEIVFSEKVLRVFEAYSRYGQRCREFGDVADVLTAYPRFMDDRRSPHLMLWAPTTCKMTRKRIPVDPTVGDGHTFRYSVGGWGLIQLLLGDARRNVITPTRIAHNSPARAAIWGERKDATDFKTIGQISGRIHRAIRKLAVARCHVSGETRGSRLVLPEAARLARGGVALKFISTAPWSYTLGVK
jgi:hypothetical protein